MTTVPSRPVSVERTIVTLFCPTVNGE